MGMEKSIPIMLLCRKPPFSVFEKTPSGRMRLRLRTETLGEALEAAKPLFSPSIVDADGERFPEIDLRIFNYDFGQRRPERIPPMTDDEWSAWIRDFEVKTKEMVEKMGRSREDPDCG